jgi:pimeloyl-ACP methyl ester carboxylesterase
VHGIGCDASFWQAQLDHFADRYTTVALDLAGHGRSGTGTREWTVEAFAADVAAVLASVTHVRQAVLVGHSLGGPVALAAAALPGTNVVGVVGVDTLHNLAPKPVSEDRLDKFVRSFAQAPMRAEEMLLDATRTDLITKIDAARARVGAEVITEAFRNLLRHQQQLPERFAAPLVLINSTDWVPTDTAAAAARGVRVELVDGVGHFPMLESPEVFNANLAQAIEWLS